MKYFDIPKPYALYTGYATTPNNCKTATGVAEWTDFARIQLAEPTENPWKISNLKFLSTENLGQLLKSETPTVVFGDVSPDGLMPDQSRVIAHWLLTMGFNIACCYHSKVSDDVELQKIAAFSGARIFDFRFPEQEFKVGNGKKRSGLRLLTVGHDANCGKKFTALTITKRLFGKVPVDFRPTGQTGMMIVDFEGGIVNDTIRADFLSGAAEFLSPNNLPNHWDIIEGQGSLFHPGFCGGSLSLLMGSQPDYIVLCIDPMRVKQRGTDFSPKSINEEILANEMMARRTNPSSRVVALSINLSNIPKSEWYNVLKSYDDNLVDISVFVCSPNVSSTFDPLIDKMIYVSESAKVSI